VQIFSMAITYCWYGKSLDENALLIFLPETLTRNGEASDYDDAVTVKRSH
jgi:hypothetical protein